MQKATNEFHNHHNKLTQLTTSYEGGSIKKDTNRHHSMKNPKYTFCI